MVAVLVGWYWLVVSGVVVRAIFECQLSVVSTFTHYASTSTHCQSTTLSLLQLCCFSSPLL